MPIKRSATYEVNIPPLVKKKKKKKSKETETPPPIKQLFRDDVLPKKSKKKSKTRDSETTDMDVNSEICNQETSTTNQACDKVKKKHKKEKKIDKSMPQLEDDCEPIGIPDGNGKPQKKKKKSKESPNLVESVTCNTSEVICDNDAPSIRKDKKKKKRNLEEEMMASHSEQQTPCKKKKKKSKETEKDVVNLKNSMTDEDVKTEIDSIKTNSEAHHSEANSEDRSPQKKKKKKKRKHEACEENISAEQHSSDEVTATKKRKIKSDNIDENDVQSDVELSAINQCAKKPKKKKKDKKEKKTIEKAEIINKISSQDSPVKHKEQSPKSAGTVAETNNAMGQWATAELKSNQQQNKFFRLLGGMKNSRTPSGDNKLKINMAMDRSQQQNYENTMESQFDQARQMMVGGVKSGGLGYERSPSEGKKFYIDSDKKNSLKFD